MKQPKVKSKRNPFSNLILPHISPFFIQSDRPLFQKLLNVLPKLKLLVNYIKHIYRKKSELWFGYFSVNQVNINVNNMNQ